MTRRAAKVDASQAMIVQALRKAGATVQHMHEVGRNCPDLLVGYRAQNFVIEIKQPGKKLKPGQRLWFEAWKGQACVATTAEEALRSIGAIKS